MLNNQKQISLIANGNQKAFTELMNITSGELLNFATGFVRKKEEAEEIVSDVYVKIWEKRKELINIKNIKSYLFISVKNGCLSYLRKSSTLHFISIDEFKDFHFQPVDSFENDIINKESLNQIYSAIEKLPPKCKMAFTLAKIHGLKYKEIADIMGVTEKTVNNHLVFAVQRITQSLHIEKNKEKLSPLKRASLFNYFW